MLVKFGSPYWSLGLIGNWPAALAPSLELLSIWLLEVDWPRSPHKWLVIFVSSSSCCLMLATIV